MPSISYNLNIPNPPNSPSADVSPMQANTNAINTFLDVDHYTFGTTNPALNIDGLHKQVTLVNKTAPGLSTGNGVLFANLANGKSWPFWQNGPNPTDVYPLLGQNSLVTSGYLTLPAGLILQWGVVNTNFATNNGTVTFPINFPTDVFSIQITLKGSSGSANTVQVFSFPGVPPPFTSFKWLSTNGSPTSYTGFYWLAIGN